MSSKYEQILDDIRDIVGNNELLKNDNKELRDELLRCLNENADLKRDNKELINKLDSLNRNYSNMVEERDTELIKNVNLHNTISEMQKVVDELNKENFELKHECNDKHIDFLKANVLELMKTNKTLKEDYEKLLKSKNELNERCCMLEYDVDFFKEEVTNLQDMYNTIENLYFEETSKNSDGLTEPERAIYEHIEKIETQNKELIEEKNMLKEDIKELQDKLEKQIKLNFLNTEVIADKIREICKLNAKVEKDTAQNSETLKACIHDKSDKLKKYKKKYKAELTKNNVFIGEIMDILQEMNEIVYRPDHYKIVNVETLHTFKCRLECSVNRALGKEKY